MVEHNTDFQTDRGLARAYADECIAVRQRRRHVEQKMLDSRRQHFGTHLARVIPEGKAVGDLYDIPAARRTTERFVTRSAQLTLPTVKWFEVMPMGETNETRLSNIDQYMSYVLRKRIKPKVIVSQLIRCLLLYGFPVLKTTVTVANKMVWPMWRACDPFSFYIYPETVNEIEEAEKVFEDHLCSLERYNTYLKRGLVTEELKQSDLTKPEWPYHLVERLAYQGITDPTADVSQQIERVENELSKTTEAFVSMTELWIRREDVQYQAIIGWNLKGGPRFLGFIKSPYDYPMYRMIVHRPLPGEMYTPSQAEDINELDNVQNDLFNMFMSAVDWEQGFVAINNQGHRHPSWQMKGRAIWEFQDDPRLMMQFLQPPVTSVNQLRAFQIVTALMQSMGGAGTIAEGQPGRNMPRAGFAMQSLVNLGMADVKDVAELIEQGILTGALSDIYKVSNLIPSDQLMRIPGGSAMYGSDVNPVQSNVLKKQDILGDWEFEWIGSQQFQDEGLRAQRAMIFFNVLTQPQVLQMLQSQGFQVNIAEMIQYIWRSTLGERGLSKILVPLQQQPSPMGVPQPSQPQSTPPHSAGSNGTPTTASNATSNGVPGLQYRLPQVTQGFVQR